MPPDAKMTGGWIVTSQLTTYGQDDQGRAVEGIKIFFQTRGGHTGSVFIPQSRYTVDNAKAELMAAAATMDAVGQLKG